jgi:hypothetical protein
MFKSGVCKGDEKYWTALVYTVFTICENLRGGKKSKQMQFITRV